MACYDGFGNLDDGRPIWIGNFWVWHGGTDILFYYPGDQNWWLGSIVNGQLTWSLVGNTAGFGQVADGRPFWVGDFNGTGGTDILFYYPGDQNWWLGSIVNGQLTWSLVGNTAGFGQVADGRPFWVGDFNGTGGTDILFYYPGDQNWWLGSIVNGQLTWSLVGNTAGFVSIHGVSAVTRRRGGLLEVLVQVEHACGSCPMSPVSSGLCRGSGLSSRRRTSRSRR